MKRIHIVSVGILVGALIAVGAGLWWRSANQIPEPEPMPDPEPTVVAPIREQIGTSVEGRAIERYTYLPVGATAEELDQKTHIAFVGAIHGGYEWNTVILAQKLMQYLEDEREAIPENVAVSVIPMANPDGVATIFGGTTNITKANAPPKAETTAGRFNANGVDLNRNFDCNWKPQSHWGNKVVDAGTGAFSEPEAKAIRDFVEAHDPAAVVFWHSAAGGVYGASCNDGILSEGREIMNRYAEAAGYPAIESFDHYEISGDVEGWLAKLGIPSVSVELTTHETVEWEQNKAGVQALLEYYGADDENAVAN